ncbi:MAG TPA: hypothetical protein VFM55_09315 [Micromonosporaceae bacterium]|nr:hypothetical protein [Micromonosporaceae bacterium]
MEISARLLHRIQLDFPHHADLVLNRLSALDGLVTQSRQDAERMLAAVVRCAAGRLDHLDRALALARLDWRDLLVAADLADEAWPARLSEWLDPGTRPDTASPGTRGELADGDGRRWQVRRRRLDLRIVKRLIRRPEVVVMLGESGGFSLRVVAAGGRDQLWETVRHAYAGPGGPQPVTGGIDYMGYEFTRADGDDDTVMLYLEQRC